MSNIKINYKSFNFIKIENIFLFSSNKPGKKVCVLGGIHGNEIAGIEAIKNIIKNFKIENGEVCFIICNEKAIQENKRYIEEDLNRCFLKNKSYTNSYEENLAKELKEIISQFDICLDIHNSTTKNTEPFVICEKNAYNLLDSINAEKVVSNFDNLEPGGTDYYMNSINKIGLCVECGYFKDKKSILFAENLIINFLKKTNNIKLNYIKYTKKKYFLLNEVYIPKTDFKLYKQFNDFEELKKNQIIGKDGNNLVYSSFNSVILFAKDINNNTQEAFLLAKKIDNIKIIRIDKDNYEIYKDGFIKIYKEIFSQAPYYEIFSDEEVEKIYQLSKLETTVTLVALDDDNVIGLALGIKLSTHIDTDFKLLLKNHFNLDKTFYNAELAVLAKYRGQGIGNELIKKRIKFAEKMGYNIICMRTKEEGSMSMSLYKKLDFKLLNGVKSISKTKKINIDDEDIRVILYKRLANKT